MAKSTDAFQERGGTAGTVSFVYAGKRGAGLDSALAFYEVAKKAGYPCQVFLSKDNMRRSLVEKVYPEAKFVDFLSPFEVHAAARQISGGVAFFTMVSPKMFPLFFAVRTKKIFCFHAHYDKSLDPPTIGAYASGKWLDILHALAIRNSDVAVVIHPSVYWQLALRFGKEASILSHPPFSVLREGFIGECGGNHLPFAKGSYFLHFGSIDAFPKGTDLLIKAASGAGMPTVFVGRTKKKIAGKNIAHLNRWVSDGELYSLIKGAKCIVVPYLATSQFSSVAALTFRFGRPVLASRSPTFDGWVEEGKTGWFFSQGDWQDLRGKMRLVASGKLKFSSKAIARKEPEMGGKSIQQMRALLERAFAGRTQENRS